MRIIPTVSPERIDELADTLARKLHVSPNMVLPFAECDDLLPQLLQACRRQETVLYAAGHVSPDIAIAADRAELTVHELFGVSPFTADAEAARKSIDSSSRILYVANPNRVTGSNLGLADLESLAASVSDGMLIVDEFYFEYFGISATPLFARYANIAVLRSFAAAFGISSANSGFLMAAPELIARVRESMGPKDISMTVFKTITTTLENESLLARRLRELHDETLRVATALNRIGIQSRITAADFLLLRVADPASVGNFLARYRIPVENLDGYPQLQRYVRYRMQSPNSNDRFLDACQKMPAEYFRGVSTDRRAVTLRRPGAEVSAPSADPGGNRLSRLDRVDNELVVK